MEITLLNIYLVKFLKEFINFGKKIGITWISYVLVGLISILLLPILTKNYSIQEYGIWVQIIVTIGLIPFIATLGLSDSMIRFLAVLKDKNEIREEFYSIFFVAISFSFIVSLCLFFSSGMIAKYLFNGNINIAYLLPVIIFMASSYYLLLNYYRTFQQMRIYSFFLLLQSIILVILVAYFAFFGYTLFYIVMGLLISYIIMFIIMFSFIVLKIGFKFPKFKNIKKYLSFSLPNIPSNLSSWVVNSSDRYLISIILGSTFVGYYSPSYALGSILTMFSGPLNVLLFPVLSNYYDSNQNDKVKLTLNYSLKYFLALAIPTVFILSILSKEILIILTTSDIALNGYLITPFIALSFLFFGLCMIVSQIIILEKKTKIIGTIWIIAAFLNFILNLILIPLFGILGSAFFTLSSYSVALSLLFFYSRKYFKYNLNPIFIGKCIVASVLSSIIMILFYPTNIFECIIIILIVFLIYIIILTVLKGITKAEITFFKDLF